MAIYKLEQPVIKLSQHSNNPDVRNMNCIKKVVFQ